MPSGNPSHPYVTSATISGKQITFNVEVTEFGLAGGSVEISGQATQNSGAFASIYQIIPVPAEPNGTGDDTGRYFVDVTSDTVPPNQFRQSEDVIVYVKVSRPWVTVLGRQPQNKLSAPGTDDVAEETTWGIARAETHIDGSTWYQPREQPNVGSDHETSPTSAL
jgi:hypothetical protein